MQKYLYVNTKENKIQINVRIKSTLEETENCVRKWEWDFVEASETCTLSAI